MLTVALTAVLCFSLLILPAFLHRFEPTHHEPNRAWAGDE
ncbi:hypothetical protein JCM19236_222 [Vibrio sp. JCM 19236]|nr:hypothetical protein JCM19236_222 [Vibrio sp. JCM 19236]